MEFRIVCLLTTTPQRRCYQHLFTTRSIRSVVFNGFILKSQYVFALLRFLSERWVLLSWKDCVHTISSFRYTQLLLSIDLCSIIFVYSNGKGFEFFTRWDFTSQLNNENESWQNIVIRFIHDITMRSWTRLLLHYMIKQERWHLSLTESH